MEDKILESVFEKATPRYRNAISVEGQEQTLASFVPEIKKRPARNVDAATALTLTCRRKQVVDKEGVPQQSPKKEESHKVKESLFASNNELSIAFLPKSVDRLKQNQPKAQNP